MKFSTVIALFVATVVSGAAASITNVEKDIALIHKNADALSKSVHDFPANGGGTVAQATVIRHDAAEFKESLDQGTKDVQGTPPFSEADSRRFFEEIKKYSPTIFTFLRDVIARRHSFENVGGVNAVPFVLKALEEIGKSANAFGEVMIKSDSASVKPQAQKLKDELAVEFHKAIDTYSK